MDKVQHFGLQVRSSFLDWQPNRIFKIKKSWKSKMKKTGKKNQWRWINEGVRAQVSQPQLPNRLEKFLQRFPVMIMITIYPRLHVGLSRQFLKQIPFRCVYLIKVARQNLMLHFTKVNNGDCLPSDDEINNRVHSLRSVKTTHKSPYITQTKNTQGFSFNKYFAICA